VLQARHGKITDYTVGAAPRQVEMPKRSPEAVLMKTKAATPASAVPATAMVLTESVKAADLAGKNGGGPRVEPKSEPRPAVLAPVTRATAQAQPVAFSPAASAAPAVVMRESPRAPEIAGNHTGGSTVDLKSEPTATPAVVAVTPTVAQVQPVAVLPTASADVTVLPESRKVEDLPEKDAGGPRLTASANLLVEVLTWGAELMVIIGAFGFGYLALRRSRPTSKASLITHSMAQQREPPDKRRGWA
jgi:hypothetical protein